MAWPHHQPQPHLLLDTRGMWRGISAPPPPVTRPPSVRSFLLAAYRPITFRCVVVFCSFLPPESRSDFLLLTNSAFSVFLRSDPIRSQQQPQPPVRDRQFNVLQDRFVVNHLVRARPTISLVSSGTLLPREVLMQCGHKRHLCVDRAGQEDRKTIMR